MSNRQTLDVRHGIDEIHAAVALSHRAFNLRVPLVADHHHFTLALAHLADFDMDLGHQRAGRIKYL